MPEDTKKETAENITEEVQEVGERVVQAAAMGSFTTREKDEILKRLNDLEDQIAKLSGDRDLLVTLRDKIELYESHAKRIPVIRTFFDNL